MKLPPALVPLCDFRVPRPWRYFVLLAGAAITWVAIALLIWTTTELWLLPGRPAASMSSCGIALPTVIGAAWLFGATARVRVFVDSAHTTVFRQYSFWGIRRTASFSLREASTATVSVTRGWHRCLNYDVYLHMVSGSSHHLTPTWTADSARALADRLNTLIERTGGTG